MLQKHSDFTYKVEYVGLEKQPVLIVDNFLDKPELLINYCCQMAQFNLTDTMYPGVRARAPDEYLDMLYQFICPIIYEVFSLKDDMVRSVESSYSIVVTPPSQLKIVQCFPHIDSGNMKELASIYYLCSEEKGGTSLYRHKETSFEYVNSERLPKFINSMAQSTANQSFSKAYINGSNELFEQIASYEAKFNRFVMYRCTSLHSGNIAENFDFDPNPRTGRLTLNTFIRCHK